MSQKPLKSAEPAKSMLTPEVVLAREATIRKTLNAKAAKEKEAWEKELRVKEAETVQLQEALRKSEEEKERIIAAQHQQQQKDQQPNSEQQSAELQNYGQNTPEDRVRVKFIHNDNFAYSFGFVFFQYSAGFSGNRGRGYKGRRNPYNGGRGRGNFRGKGYFRGQRYNSQDRNYTVSTVKYQLFFTFLTINFFDCLCFHDTQPRQVSPGAAGQEHSQALNHQGATDPTGSNQTVPTPATAPPQPYQPLLTPGTEPYYQAFNPPPARVYYPPPQRMFLPPAPFGASQFSGLIGHPSYYQPFY